MKHHTHFLAFFLILLFSCQIGSAQSFTISSGKDIVTPGGQISFTVGQLLSSTLTGSGFTITTGVHQPFEISIFPVELMYFRAEAHSGNQGAIRLSWATASELNNDYFTVERSSQGLVWEVVEQVKGKGNSQEVSNYELLDKQPYLGTSFYRLKQTDLDGTFNYSNIASVWYESQDIQVYPNPSHDFLQLSVEGSSDGLSYTLYSANGQKIDGKALSNARTNIEVENLPKGLYYLVVSSETEILKTSKIIKN